MEHSRCFSFLALIQHLKSWARMPRLNRILTGWKHPWSISLSTIVQVQYCIYKSFELFISLSINCVEIKRISIMRNQAGQLVEFEKAESTSNFKEIFSLVQKKNLKGSFCSSRIFVYALCRLFLELRSESDNEENEKPVNCRKICFYFYFIVGFIYFSFCCIKFYNAHIKWEMNML